METKQDITAHCRWCEKTKPILEMAIASWKGTRYTGVCSECMNAPDWQRREGAYIMRDLLPKPLDK